MVVAVALAAAAGFASPLELLAAGPQAATMVARARVAAPAARANDIDMSCS
jgi:hypothetical protein